MKNCIIKLLLEHEDIPPIMYFNYIDEKMINNIYYIPRKLSTSNVLNAIDYSIYTFYYNAIINDKRHRKDFSSKIFGLNQVSCVTTNNRGSSYILLLLYSYTYNYYNIY